MEQIKELFEKNKYVKVENFLDKGIAQFLYEYMLTREATYEWMLHKRLIVNQIKAPYLFGQYEPDNDMGYQGAFTLYADPAMETLLGGMTNVIGSLVGLTLDPTYSFCRIYKKDHELKPHKDRPACEISATVCLGYEENTPWSINMQNEESETVTTVSMKQGDAVIYRGCDVVHGRDPYAGKQQGQVFLHYNDMNGPHYNKEEGGMPKSQFQAVRDGSSRFDNRECLGVLKPEQTRDLIEQLSNADFRDRNPPKGLFTNHIKPSIPWEKLTEE